MERPKVVRLVGRRQECPVFIEDYVITFICGLKSGRPEEKCRVILYGKKERDAEGEFYIVFGAVKVTEDGKDDEHPEYARAKEIFKGFEAVGCLNMHLWRTSELTYAGILIGDENGGQPATGYYMFYDVNESMKEYMNDCYKLRLKKTNIKNQSAYVSEPEEPATLFQIMRAVVIGIFIFLCAIAVTTIDGYDEMEEVTNTAADMIQTLEEVDQ